MKFESARTLQTQDGQEPVTWRVVTQVKSNRVVYFTDDTAYAPPTEGDWYFVSFYQGELPEGMTLRNCWGWRYNGNEFTDARDKPLRAGPQSLLAANKAALQKLLREKIDAWRRPFSPTSVMGQALREAKLSEAALVLAGSADERQLRLLPSAAAARGVSLLDLASEIQRLHAETERVLVESENVREEIAAAIHLATTQKELNDLRQRLIESVSPEVPAPVAKKPEDTTPARLQAKPSTEELAQEQLRLRVQLRLKINALRRAELSEYLLDDMVLKYKGNIARQLVTSGGKVPPGLDVLPLISHAASRGITLLDAAHEVVREMQETAQMLLETEQMKDAFLARIAATSTYEDLERVGNAIRDAKASEPGAAAQARVMPAAPSPYERNATTLAHWRRGIVLASKAMAIPKTIDRVRGLDTKALRALAQRGLPFVVEDLVPQWPLALMSMEAFTRTYGHLQVVARVEDYVDTAFTWARAERAMSMASFLEVAQAEQSGLPPYIGNQRLPDITALCNWPDLFQTWDEPKVWLGPAGTVTPLHCDGDDNLLAQVWGSKKLTLFAPSQAELFDPQPRTQVLFASDFNPEAPDYQAYPRAREAQAVECTLSKGDMLYLPAGWMHHVRATEFSLSINRWSQALPLVLSKDAT